MPKVRSQRTIARAHAASAKPVDRTFAVQDNAVQHVDVGALKDASADELLHSVNNADTAPAAQGPALSKKEKRTLKHELFVERLEASRAPYSKSHARRLKRKEKEQLTGDLSVLRSVLSSVESGARPAGEEADDGAPAQDGAGPSTAPAQPPPRPGQIGEGKGAPLKRSQRKRALKAEQFRQPLILATPEFAANPFETIRTHARNTLVAHKLAS
ncbi:ribosome biogenesis protein SLX9-domain-containing protein [Gloeopeniophorella convolvens]|nr:ribosome biogenesis protein SLX9-domain-containing protein [Gloeopeniophorella convolvens]